MIDGHQALEQRWRPRDEGPRLWVNDRELDFNSNGRRRRPLALNTHPVSVSVFLLPSQSAIVSDVVPSSSSRSTLHRYVLYQIPGWILAMFGAVLLHQVENFPMWACLGLVVGWAVKDALLYPFLRDAYETDSLTAIERLIGLNGVAVESLNPNGYIRVRGELWRAEPSPDTAVIGSGHVVRVDAVRGTILIVRHADPGAARNDTSRASV